MYAQFEASLGEQERARQIFEIAIAQQELDMPEAVWKAYIDFEIANNDFTLVRNLYQRLLDITQHYKVWVSFAKFEEETSKDCAKAREIYQRAYLHFKDEQPDLKEERVMILEEWLQFESSESQGGFDS